MSSDLGHLRYQNHSSKENIVDQAIMPCQVLEAKILEYTELACRLRDTIALDQTIVYSWLLVLKG